ncbi:unnamed protein product [Arctogadus glacialis]
MSLFVLHFYCVSRPPISEKKNFREGGFVHVKKPPSFCCFGFGFFSLCKDSKSQFLLLYIVIKRNISGDEGISLQVLSVRQAETDVCRMPKFCGIHKGF